MQVFCFTWVEAINNQRENGLRELADEALDYDTFSAVFSRLAGSCRLPDLRARDT
jgi:hypothetical protein